jgi:hypothetical protein
MRRVEQNVPRPLNINPMAAMKGGENKRTMKKKKKNLCISTLTYAATT